MADPKLLAISSSSRRLLGKLGVHSFNSLIAIEGSMYLLRIYSSMPDRCVTAYVQRSIVLIVARSSEKQSQSLGRFIQEQWRRSKGKARGLGTPGEDDMQESCRKTEPLQKVRDSWGTPPCPGYMSTYVAHALVSAYPKGGFQHGSVLHKVSCQLSRVTEDSGA